jgi:hypothetical protein
LIDLGDIFLRDFANLGMGMLDRERTTWQKVKAFPNNVEMQVECTFQMGGYGGLFGMFGDTGIIDPRGITLVLHYSLTKRPEAGYKPRYADYRVGHFLSATKDFGADDPETTFRRRINRWRLEKANPESELSAPKKQIVWWVESTVPHEYRPYVEQGILEWNKAFEKIGFRNAIGVRWQNDNDEFDPEDVNYCTFRWITTPNTFAMSGLRADPVTGEMIDGDVIFDASWVRAWKNEYALLVGQPVGMGDSGRSALEILQAAEVISPMLAARRGFGMPISVPSPRSTGVPMAQAQEMTVHAVPSSMSAMQLALSRRLIGGRYAACQCAIAKQHEYALAAMAMAVDTDEKESNGEKEKKLELPEGFLGQAIKEVVMHEVGHSLGLRHNFRASTIRTLEQVNDPAFTKENGMVGSVMDYNPLNIARKGEKQGEFSATTIGPYDYWAIEFAYNPVQGDEEKELDKIAARSPEPDLTFGTDEDLYMSNDPTINAYDLGSDPLAYAKDRMRLASELLDNLDAKIVAEGESWARLRNGFSVLLGQFGNAAFIASSYIGGQYVSRDAKGEKSRDPVVPVEFERQREALRFLVEQILADETFQFSPRILRRLTSESWYHWGGDGFFFDGSGFDVFNRVLGIQKIALNHCFDGAVLKRIQNQALMANDGDKPLGLDEVFQSITDGVWSELDPDKKETSCSAIRRNLQREHLNKLCQIVLGSSVNPYEDMFAYLVLVGPGMSGPPADARSLARSHLRDIEARIVKALENGKADALTKSHLEECRDVIAKSLKAEIEQRRT